MSDDITQPVKVGSPLSERYPMIEKTWGSGVGWDREPRERMTMRDLAQRLWHAEHRYAARLGDFPAFQIALSYDNWADIVTEVRDAETWNWIGFDPETDRHTFRGSPIRVDTSLKNGEVRLRIEVPA
jgi:hypothetical protein